jgi:DNA-directed RNA polymerase subunit K/omega
MLYPTIGELTKGKFNRYELALATAKCARLITEEYVRQREAAEKSMTGNKDTDKPLTTLIDKEYRDEKAVKTAISRIYRGDYLIVARTEEEIAALLAAEKAAEAAAAEKVVEAEADEAEEQIASEEN